MRQQATNPIGFFSVICAAFLWASSGSFAKHLFQKGVSPFALVQIRLTVAAITIGLFLLLLAPRLLRIRKRDLPYFLGLGIFAMAGAQFTYLFAISRIQVAAAILLQYLAPVLIAAWEVLFCGRRLSARTGMALFSAMAGCAFVLNLMQMQLSAMDPLGILAGLGAAVTFATYSVAGASGVRTYGPATVVCYAMLFGAITWNLVLPPLSGFAALPDGISWTIALGIGVFGTALPFGLYLMGVQQVGAAPASITGTLEPVFAGILCYFLLGEILTPTQITGVFLVIFAVILLQIPETKTAKAIP